MTEQTMGMLAHAGMLPDDDNGPDEDDRDYSQVDMLFMGRPEACKFDSVGDTVTGLVVDLFTQQAKDFDTGAPKFWDDGRPVMDPVVILQTSEGLRTLYVGSYRMRNAIRDAVLAAGFERGGSRAVPGLRKDGRLLVRRLEDAAPAKKGGQPPKDYAAGYDPPGRKPISPLPDVPAPAAGPDAGPPF
jgi:hypothetical protein